MDCLKVGATSRSVGGDVCLAQGGEQSYYNSVSENTLLGDKGGM